MLIFAIIAVFVAGLMIGRTPEYLGKKIESFEMKMAAVPVLIPPPVVPVGTAIAVMVDRGLGVSILPDWAPPWPEGLSLAKLPLPNAGSFVRHIGVVWPRASRRLGLVYALLEQAAVARAQGPTRNIARARALR